MIVFLLLVIVAILLFGSSAVIGAFGWLLGGLAAVVAVGYGIYLLDVSSGTVVLCVICFLGLLFVSSVGASKSTDTIPDPRPIGGPAEVPDNVRKAVEEQRRLLEEYKAKINGS